MPELTLKIVPVSAFSGRPPSAGGLNRGSRQVPVQTGRRVDLRVGVRLLVRDERAVAVLPARLPEDLVAAEERQVHAGVARRLDVRALGTRPVLVVAYRQEGPVLADLGAEAVAVDVREVRDVVAVALQPAHHRVLGVEDPVLGGVLARGERPVVADLVGPPRRRARVEAVAAVSVIGLPGGVRGLEEEIRASVVVADDEGDVAGAGSAVLAHEPREVDAGDRGARHVPGCRGGPVAAVDQAGRAVAQTFGLTLQRRGRHGSHQPRPVPAVPTHAVDVDAVGGGRGVHLELDGLALIDADVRGEALDAGVAGAADIPLARRIAGPAVLGNDLVRRRGAGSVWAHAEPVKRVRASAPKSAASADV